MSLALARVDLWRLYLSLDLLEAVLPKFLATPSSGFWCTLREIAMYRFNWLVQLA